MHDVQISKLNVDEAMNAILQELAIQSRSPIILRDIQELCGASINFEKVVELYEKPLQIIVNNLDHQYLPEYLQCAHKRILNSMHNAPVTFVRMLSEIFDCISDMSNDLLKGIITPISVLNERVASKIRTYF